MIDTVRVKIRIDKELRTKMLRDCTGDHMGSISIPPYQYKINFFLDKYSAFRVYLEGSLPKVWYGENVHLLYEEQLDAVLQIIHKAFTRRYGSFPPYSVWVIQRLDVVYAWKFESEEKAEEVIEYVRGLEIARNSKHFYGENESVVFGSKKSRTFTFYRKYPEFKKKGFPALLKSTSYEEAQSVLDLSSGVVRFEIMNRPDFLLSQLDVSWAVVFDMILDKEKEACLSILKNGLSKLTGSADLKQANKRAVMKSLLAKYKKNMALRLFCFFNTYYSDIKSRKLIRKYCNSSDVANNLKEIKEASISIPDFLASSKFDLSIPNSLVVNGPPSSTAVAAELDRRLQLIDDSIVFIDDGLQKGIPFPSLADTVIPAKD